MCAGLATRGAGLRAACRLPAPVRGRAGATGTTGKCGAGATARQRRGHDRRPRLPGRRLGLGRIFGLGRGPGPVRGRPWLTRGSRRHRSRALPRQTARPVPGRVSPSCVLVWRSGPCNILPCVALRQPRDRSRRPADREGLRRAGSERLARAPRRRGMRQPDRRHRARRLVRDLSRLPGGGPQHKRPQPSRAPWHAASCRSPAGPVTRRSRHSAVRLPPLVATRAPAMGRGAVAAGGLRVMRRGERPRG
jgi:hypothetical protein